MGNNTEVEPPGANLSVYQTEDLEPTSLNYSQIVFSVPNGNYSYVAGPSLAFNGNPSQYSGTVKVDNSDITVTIEGRQLASCGTLVGTANSTTRSSP